MISFFPGPSRIYDEIPGYTKDAYRLGILSMYHRSDAFMHLCKRTRSLLHETLNVPPNYRVYYVSSATECWEIIAQSLISKKSRHIFNGAFGEKWFQYTQKICEGASAEYFDPELILGGHSRDLESGDLICLTQNETSNGTSVSNKVLHQIRKNNPLALIAVDATSSMGGVALSFKNADVWFASVQKCLGLPAGLSLMICSPRAIRQVKANGENQHYNSLLRLDEMMKKWQTPYTPNVLGIYLLMRILEQVKPIEKVDEKIKERYDEWLSFFEKTGLSPLVLNKKVHSLTVLALQCPPDRVKKLKKKAIDHGILLGDGYGKHQADSIRIANFPAIKASEIELLKKFLRKFAPKA